MYIEVVLALKCFVVCTGWSICADAKRNTAPKCHYPFDVLRPIFEVPLNIISTAEPDPQTDALRPTLKH